MTNALVQAPGLLIKILILLVELTGNLIFRLLALILPLRPKKDLKNEIVLITGAASGIGQLMAYKFSKQGAKLIVCWDLNEKGNNETIKNIKNNGGKAVGLTCNLANMADTYRAVEETKELIKKTLNDTRAYVSILVNNAGVVTGKSFLECPDKLINLTMDVNTTAHFWTIKGFLPDMIKNNKGHVCTIASGAGLSGMAGLMDYCASKFGAVGLSESLYYEMQKQNKENVHVTTICPYFIATGMFEGVSNHYPWLLPIIKPNDMADEIVTAVRQNKEMVVHPKILWGLYYLKPLLGMKYTWKALKAMKLETSMDRFVQTRDLNKKM